MAQLEVTPSGVLTTVGCARAALPPLLITAAQAPR